MGVMSFLTDRRTLRLAKLALAATGIALAAAMPARAADDDDNSTFEQRIIRNLLGGGSNADIDYRERSPLVIPPSGAQNALPPPDPGARTRDMAAWPKDPDKNRAKPKGSGIRGAFEQVRESERPLTPGEMRKGRVAGAGRSDAPARPFSEMESGRALTPSEVSGGREEKTIFGMFGAQFGPKQETKFAGEPTRRGLTDPPVGYQTPSSAQPYQPPPSTGLLGRIPTFFDRGTEPPR